MSLAERRSGLLSGRTALASIVLLSVFLSGRGRAEAQGAAAARRKLIEQLGLPKSRPGGAGGVSGTAAPAPSSSPASSAADSDADAPSDEAGRGTGGAAAASAAAKPAPPAFRGRVHRQLLAACKVCHAPGAPAGITRLVLSGEPRADYNAVKAFANPANPKGSPLLTKAAGQAHGGGPTAPEGSPVYRALLLWITAGARLDPAPEGVAAAEGGTGAAVVAPPTASSSAARRRTSTAGPRPSAVPPAGVLPPPGAPSVTPGATPGAPATSDVTAELAAGVAGAQMGGAVPPTTGAATTGTTPSRPAGPSFADVHPTLRASCGFCHGPQGPAAATRLRLDGDPRRDYAAVAPFTDPASPAQSLLLRKGRGEMHGGGPSLAASSAGYDLLRRWIAAGAPGPDTVDPGRASATAGAAPPAVPGSDPAAAPPAVSEPVTASAAAAASAPSQLGPPPPGAAGPHGPGLSALMADVRLNGRFDLNYERRGISGSPFTSGQDVLTSYHHFVFLSRHSGRDPFGFNAELIEQRFWELSMRWRAPGTRWGGFVKAGKVLVPFGVEPLFHQSYGGHAGFDQRLLPIIWATEGLTAQVNARWGMLTFTDDVFIGRGHRLTAANAILNLQTNVSSADDVTIALGNRAGVSFGPVAAWYSFYYSPLGFGRRVVMQAIDAELWRLAGVPVLDRLTIGIGAMRADVSGGGSGFDHYHFGDYLVLRFRLADYLYVQYRQGLRTINNRRGAYLDSTRLTAEDGSTHNVGLIYRRHGMMVGLYQFWNLEKVNEVRDDFFRAVVAYDF